MEKSYSVIWFIYLRAQGYSAGHMFLIFCPTYFYRLGDESWGLHHPQRTSILHLIKFQCWEDIFSAICFNLLILFCYTCLYLLNTSSHFLYLSSSSVSLLLSDPGILNRASCWSLSLFLPGKLPYKTLCTLMYHLTFRLKHYGKFSHIQRLNEPKIPILPSG